MEPLVMNLILTINDLVIIHNDDANKTVNVSGNGNNNNTDDDDKHKEDSDNDIANK